MKSLGEKEREEEKKQDDRPIQQPIPIYHLHTHVYATYATFHETNTTFWTYTTINQF